MEQMKNRKDKYWMLAIAIPLLGAIAVCSIAIMLIVIDMLFGLGITNNI